MRLTIWLPHRKLLDTTCVKVIAESTQGAFCLLPHHIDYVAPLVPGIVVFQVKGDPRDQFAAVDEGVLVKCAQDVRISTRQAVLSADLGELQRTIEKEFLVHDEWQRKVRSAAARLESSLVRKFLEFSK